MTARPSHTGLNSAATPLRGGHRIVPWTIGHAAVFSIVQAGGSVPVPVSVWLLTVVAYVLPIMYVAFLFVGQGRTPYDLISGTVVIQEVQAATSS